MRQDSEKGGKLSSESNLSRSNTPSVKHAVFLKRVRQMQLECARDEEEIELSLSSEIDPFLQPLSFSLSVLASASNAIDHNDKILDTRLSLTLFSVSLYFNVLAIVQQQG